jgi:hypothetical protein
MVRRKVRMRTLIKRSQFPENALNSLLIVHVNRMLILSLILLILSFKRMYLFFSEKEVSLQFYLLCDKV